MDTFGLRFRALRARSGLSMRDLATELGVSYNSVFKWEADLMEPRRDSAIRIASYFGADLAWLLNGPESGETHPSNEARVLFSQLSEESQQWVLQGLRMLVKKEQYDVSRIRNARQKAR